MRKGMSELNSKLVYSTGQAMPQKGKPPQKEGGSAEPSGRQRVAVRLDRKGRGGKTVTVVEGLRMKQQERESLLAQLKTRFGTGGTIRDSGFEIQGDHRDAIMHVLTDMGYRPKRSGG